MLRINEASGPYQMFQFLGDMVVFKGSGSTWTAEYFDEVPLSNFHNRSIAHPRIIWTFRYGDDFYGPAVLGPKRVGSTSMYNAHQSTLVHPKVEYFRAGEMNASRSLFMQEDIFTSWTTPLAYSPLVRFVARALKDVTGDETWAQPESFSDAEAFPLEVEGSVPSTPSPPRRRRDGVDL
jgi:hypothetical protein